MAALGTNTGAFTLTGSVPISAVGDWMVNLLGLIFRILVIFLDTKVSALRVENQDAQARLFSAGIWVPCLDEGAGKLTAPLSELQRTSHVQKVLPLIIFTAMAFHPELWFNGTTAAEQGREDQSSASPKVEKEYVENVGDDEDSDLQASPRF
ncbi:hypothetical protein BOTBODRAFT_43096 [Botryobasidium botryosum FD-172 SS1]|uniref:Uncharacterized protein n=1 Tax=Botryobasidium botryosum (strain FD-172 SS1) TaxID=930990 RepID=A0A067MQF1_BOTB1|nr:hypothetical protein BOTBODRAFT_43096 [Botryobasidium botryosum FD-172 SS1]